MLDVLVAHSVIGAALTYACITTHILHFPLLRKCACWVLICGLLKHELARTQSNYYDELNVQITATKIEIHQAYRQASKAYHPDKNPNVPNADAIFHTLKQAYEVLSNDKMRSNYDRYGDMQTANNRALETVDDKLVGVVVALALVTQGLCLVVGYVCTFPKPLNQARQLLLVYNLGVFCVELHMRLMEVDAYGWLPYLGGMLPFERIMILRRMYPSVLCLSLMLSHYLYVDQQAVIEYILRGVISSNRVICERLHTLHRILPTGVLNRAGGPSTSSLRPATNVPATSAAIKAKLAGLKLVQEGASEQLTEKLSEEQNKQLHNYDATKTKTAELKLVQEGVSEDSTELNESFRSSLGRGKGKKGAEKTTQQPNPTSSGSNDQIAEKWKQLTETLSEEQKKQLHVYVATKTARVKPSIEESERSSISWPAMLLWGLLLGYWFFFHKGHSS